MNNKDQQARKEFRIDDILGYVKVVFNIPNKAPRTYNESIVLYFNSQTNPSVKRLYIYAREMKQWYFINLN